MKVVKLIGSKFNRYFFILSITLFFVLMSFVPTFYDLASSDKLPVNRFHVLEHNYMFDFNFYLSRIQQGIEGRWLVSEKYYNHPHMPSLFQIAYLYLGKIGAFFNLSATSIYHLSRFVFGFLLLWVSYKYIGLFFKGIWQTAAYILVITASSWPVLAWAGKWPRFATYMGWWSVIDGLQRITNMPHILIGQLLMVLILMKYSGKYKGLKDLIFWSVVGFMAGIIFPPVLFIIYFTFFVQSLFEILDIFAVKENWERKKILFLAWFKTILVCKFIFIFFSGLSLIYINIMFRYLPWSALALFDIQHRMPLPYKAWFLALGPVLPLGLGGLILSFVKIDKKMYPVVSWILAIGLLCVIFEKIPQQSPLRWTEGAIHIPLGILAVYFLRHSHHLFDRLKLSLRRLLKGIVIISYISVILLGFSVMLSMIFWLTDQVYAKRVGTFPVPLGAELAYPLKDFMDGVKYLRDVVPNNAVILTYITAGNFIPAYSGHYVYIGHANTPDEDGKEPIAADFFSGKMGEVKGKEFLEKERISYIYYGPQEKRLGGIADLRSIYPYLEEVYRNEQVIIYRVIMVNG